ncbi:MAG TPA: DUF1569 domain-containing protein [Candidatus Sulfotelmatobacter sp.]|nr:DUF1569 domain-containing protein [Candidatus Sulfotelmatobacter sp.]
MKGLNEPAGKREILQRLEDIHPDSPRQWGKMTPHQMICHLSDGFRMFMGDKKVAPQRTPIPRSLLRFVAIWVPLRWPKGFRAAPELDQQKGGTRPAEFEADKRQLRGLIERFTRTPKDYTFQPHPHFGQLSEQEWMRLAYLHADHHLRQFGA